MEKNGSPCHGTVNHVNYSLATSLVLFFPDPLSLFHAFLYHTPRRMEESTSAMLWYTAPGSLALLPGRDLRSTALLQVWSADQQQRHAPGSLLQT